MPGGPNMFRQLTMAARDAIIIINQQGRLAFWNPAAAGMFGYGQADLPEQDIYQWLIPERFHEAYRNMLNSGEHPSDGKTREIVMWRQDGSEFPAEISLSSIRILGRWHVLGILRDISERKRVEEELTKDRNLLHALMEHSDGQIYFKDLHSRFMWCSASQTKWFENCDSIDDVIGKTDHDFFSEEHADSARRDELEIMRTGQAISGKVEKETWPDGRVTWVITNKMPFRDEAGNIIGTFGISKDITEIKEAEIKVEQLHKKVVAASRQAGMAEVATSVLHNIGNVLNSVNVSCSVISERISGSKISGVPKVASLLRANANDLPGFFADGSAGQKLPDYLEQLAGQLQREQEEILRETGMLAENIQHIKEVIAMQQDTARTLGLVETLPVPDLVEDALRLNLGAVERHGIDLARDYTEVPPISIEKNKVLQILVNLIRNAKYACDDSGRTDKLITIRIEPGEEGTVLISVEDNGIGIPKENFTRIFNHGFTTRKEGHGFGLHSGALAAKELGGCIHVFSDGPGCGARFTLQLPIEPKRK
ncbi:MAG: PAS domain S-box protein [Pontiellaceae bacterium]|nr:PAS domain S-box protein [Pontiellaceae bacterium]MBN2784636.1 PAS domain S-box protein [Pontiellaceae bacterium]